LKQIFGLVPAAGVGARMCADRPKQYLPLGSQTLLERSVQALLADARVARVYVVVAPQDAAARAMALPARCEFVFDGGATRAHTVRNGLRALRDTARPDDLVLVHDGARPCLSRGELADLIDGAGGDEHGGLLAVPVTDTVKRAQDGRVAGTVDRTGLWRALTPQLFPLGVLTRALERALGDAAHGAAPAVTDEASAVEGLGLHPRLIAGAPTNIKVTAPADLPLAEAILRQQGRW
jgi:2-C-methyl-D-erythritol 4-phosphate cytidylyltransferase